MVFPVKFVPHHDVERILQEIPLDLSKSTTHDVDSIYASYGIQEREYHILTFEEQK